MILINEFLNNVEHLIRNIGFLGPVISCLLIVIESMLPILPLAVFITFNFWFFGNFIGFIISWIFTIIGCVISYFIFDKKVKGFYNRKILKNEKIKNFSKIFEKLSFQQLVVIIAIPFTPAFLVNIVAGVTDTVFRKYFWALVIGKIFLVWFWGYIGTSLIDSISNPIIIVKIIVILLIAYAISKIVNTKLKIE